MPVNARVALVARISPTTSSFAPGVIVPSPTLPPVWNSAEFSRVVPLVQMGMKFLVPAPVTGENFGALAPPAWMRVVAAFVDAFVAIPGALLGFACTNAEAGKPP